MRSGRLCNRLLIETPTLTANSYGERETTWTTFCRCWGSVVQMGGAESVRMAQTQPNVTHKLLVRYMDGVTSGITPKMRVKLGTRYLYIERVNNVEEAGETIELYCGEKVDG